MNLDPNDVSLARQDRDNLRARVQGLQNSVDRFPVLYTEADIDFGSFARRTKRRPLDDVDMFFCLSAEGSATYQDTGNEGIVITVSSSSSNLYWYTGDDNKSLSSIKILNKFKRSLEGIYQYRSSELNRRQEAVTLKLTTRDWSFDLVPCFLTSEVDGRNFYLIPDGNGNWKKTDPRVDKDRTTNINQANGGNVLEVIRLIKYWNGRKTMPSMGSYLLENIVLNYYEGRILSASKWVDIEFPKVLEYLMSVIFNVIPDPKGYVADLNDLSGDDRMKIYVRAYLDHGKAVEARALEANSQSGTHKECMAKWREIFGEEFPEYG
ncbi:SMODS domain-containing nucleotidyltransferase [Pseudomonas aeruginosa]|uniref:SMODS domain-containing nucleotidyltransferase n=1 Tax=Pseudomonas aeruginosa TaxID=287 RepID=UPI000F54696B|nr:nucleotidyltransferase [Pseudomonas aeruginosa]HBO2567165.1 nucleotidyltransferase [Pseudomonas aeruginosa]HBO2618202.1 nucleotidyltransferase [Pseudomonas aeruginosa]HBO2636518.1 nucleotidyltransferase [Pseudomonas aeruginosa]HEP8744781.1 nucleotidyltransferase [Pseudomonas aeruginosa]